MYPFGNGLEYPRNQWWIGALSDEVGRSLLERRILGELVVFFRTEARRPVALMGLCPHRLYPLALGELIGDTIACGYHRFRFDGAGKCVSIPSQEKFPSGFRTRTFQLVERPPFVWIWTGDDALAETTPLPDYKQAALGPEYYTLT